MPKRVAYLGQGLRDPAGLGYGMGPPKSVRLARLEQVRLGQDRFYSNKPNIAIKMYSHLYRIKFQFLELIRRLALIFRIIFLHYLFFGVTIQTFLALIFLTLEPRLVISCIIPNKLIFDYNHFCLEISLVLCGTAFRRN